MPRLKVFISSVQKEMANERLAVSILLSTDNFLQKHTAPRLYEYAPAPLKPDEKGYLALLRSSQVYVLIIGKEYGRPVPDSGLSATHEEYRLAMELKLPVLVCVLGDNRLKREEKTKDFFGEIRAGKHTYSRFNTVSELETIVRNRLIEHIRTEYDESPTETDNKNAEQNIRAADIFERQLLDRIAWKELNHTIARQMVASAEEKDAAHITPEEVRDYLFDRGYLWQDSETGDFFATAAGVLLLAPDPSNVFPHARIQVDAYAGTVRTAKADDFDFLRGPVTEVLEKAVQFVRKNTRHPLRVVGLKRITVDEYPEAALREALINAIVHRDYNEAGIKVTLEVYHDRIIIINPGLPVGGQKLRRIASGKGRSRSRNPLLAQGLTWLDAMEDRGTGIMRMSDAMADHGLDRPILESDDGCVVVTLPGPADNLDRIIIPDDAGSGFSPSLVSSLNERQKKMLEHTIEDGTISTAWCLENLGVVKDTIRRDFDVLVGKGLIEKVGKGRGTHYIPAEATTNGSN